MSAAEENERERNEPPVAAEAELGPRKLGQSGRKDCSGHAVPTRENVPAGSGIAAGTAAVGVYDGMVATFASNGFAGNPSTSDQVPAATIPVPAWSA